MRRAHARNSSRLCSPFSFSPFSVFEFSAFLRGVETRQSLLWTLQAGTHTHWLPSYPQAKHTHAVSHPASHVASCSLLWIVKKSTPFLFRDIRLQWQRLQWQFAHSDTFGNSQDPRFPKSVTVSSVLTVTLCPGPEGVTITEYLCIPKSASPLMHQQRISVSESFKCLWNASSECDTSLPQS